MNKVGTVALIVRLENDRPVLLEAISDLSEIRILESAILSGEKNPLETVYSHRDQQRREEEEFGDYVEDLLVRTGGLRPDIREHGIQWFESKTKIERYKKVELEATRVIAQYACEIYAIDRSKTDFVLAGPSAEVHIRVFAIEIPKDMAA